MILQTPSWYTRKSLKFPLWKALELWIWTSWIKALEIHFGHKALQNLKSSWNFSQFFVALPWFFWTKNDWIWLNHLLCIDSDHVVVTGSLQDALSFSVGFKGISPWFLKANLLDKTWDFQDTCCKFQQIIASCLMNCYKHQAICYGRYSPGCRLDVVWMTSSLSRS